MNENLQLFKINQVSLLILVKNNNHQQTTNKRDKNIKSERFFSRLNLKPFKIIISNDEDLGKYAFNQKRKSAAAVQSSFSNCVSENNLLQSDSVKQSLNDVFITRVQTVGNYFQKNITDDCEQFSDTKEETDANQEDKSTLKEQDKDEYVDHHHFDEDEPDLDFNNNFHKARTLISSRMDDVRALKQMITDTKQTIQDNRRNRILNSINKESWSKFATPTQQHQLIMMRTQTAGVKNRQNTQQLSEEVRVKSNFSKPSQTYSDVIAMKYQKQEEQHDLRKKKRKSKHRMQNQERSSTAAVGNRGQSNQRQLFDLLNEQDNQNSNEMHEDENQILKSNIVRYSEDSRKNQHTSNISVFNRQKQHQQPLIPPKTLSQWQYRRPAQTASQNTYRLHDTQLNQEYTEKQNDDSQNVYQLSSGRKSLQNDWINFRSNDGEDVKGKVIINIFKGNIFEHQGITVELVGIIENSLDAKQNQQFVSIVRDLEPPGELNDNVSYDYTFSRVEKPFETYNGINVKLRYFIQVVINRSYNKIIKEEEFVVHHVLSQEPIQNPPIKMEVGINDFMHIAIDIDRSKFHIKDCIVGQIHFNLIKIRIKHMEVAIIQRETIGSGNQSQSENQTLSRFEVMDGSPIKDEKIPVRFYLSSTPLTPTYKNINNKFSCRYFLKVILIDEEGRKYFKQSEIEFWRNKI
eukprot:403347921